VDLINIAKKKLPTWAISIMLYVGFCACNLFTMRGSLAYYGQQYGMPGWFVNDVWAFFIGGIIPFAIYEILCSVIFHAVQLKTGGDTASLKYGLHLTVIAANVFLFLLKFIYVAVPLYAPIIDIILDPIVMISFAALYMWYAFYQNYVEKSRYRIAVTQVFGAFIVLYGLLTVINLILVLA